MFSCHTDPILGRQYCKHYRQKTFQTQGTATGVRKKLCTSLQRPKVQLWVWSKNSQSDQKLWRSRKRSWLFQRLDDDIIAWAGKRIFEANHNNVNALWRLSTDLADWNDVMESCLTKQKIQNKQKTPSQMDVAPWCYNYTGWVVGWGGHLWIGSNKQTNNKTKN